MINTNQRDVDCKSSIREFDSLPRLHSFGVDDRPNRLKKGIASSGGFVISLPQVDIPITICDRGKYIAIRFEYKGHKHTTRLNTSVDDLEAKDIFTLVTKIINEIDGFVSLRVMLDFYLEHGTGSLNTRKKNVSNFIDYCKREGISLDETVQVLSKTDELGRTVPERWQEIYNLPHKLRQVRSIFGRKNLSLFKREGWDTKVFGNFVSFIPETTVSQPFSTSDSEVQHIINFFNNARDQHPVFYDIYLLAFGCGLRQSEIYQIKYEHFTEFNGQCFLNLPFATKRTKLKGIASGEKVGISRQVFDHFRCRELQGEVITGGNRLHKRFIRFLKNDVGITEVKACHRLRKILGARLASTAGIYHAAKTLRNSVQVAERYYSDLVEHRNELTV